MNAIIALALIIVLAVILGWHWLFVGAVAVTATVWAIVIASVILFCVAILALFILTGLSILAVGFIGVIWTILGILLFPVLFPVLVPLLIILLFISYIRKNRR